MLEYLRTYFIASNGEIAYSLYAALFLVNVVITFILTMLLMKLASKIGIVDKPSSRKVHNNSIPKLGGLAIFISLVVTFGLASVLHPQIKSDFISSQSIAIFVGMGIMLLLGIYDDIFKASWMWKFAFQIVAACIIVRHGILVSKITNPFSVPIQLGAWGGMVFTIAWVVGITNAINLSDGLDGLASGIVIIVCAVTFANSIHLMRTRPEQYQLFVFAAVTSVCVLGAALAFLKFNFYPAKIFLGDTGSLLLGFLIACTAIRSSQLNTTTVALVVPIIALGLPILDTVLAFLRRTSKRKNPFRADMEHIHHKIMESGLSHPETVLVLYGFCLVLGIAALVLALKTNQYSGVILFVLTAITLVGFKKFGMLDITRLWGIHDKKKKKENEPRK